MKYGVIVRPIPHGLFAIDRQEMVAALSMAYVQSAFPLIFTLVIVQICTVVCIPVYTVYIIESVDSISRDERDVPLIAIHYKCLNSSR